MMYLIFSLAALFLTACADPDNPVVYTAPAGKAVADDDEVKQPPGTNYGSYEEIPYVPVDPPETAAQTLADEGTNSQTSGKLVGSLGHSTAARISFERDHRQDFTTGPNALGWKLTAVNLSVKLFSSDTTPPAYTVKIWTTDGGATLTGEIGTLTNPSELSDGDDNEFTGDIDLAANTTYALVVDVTGDEDGTNFQLNRTNQPDEDGG